MAVITMSRQRGSMGSYIALEVADRLGWRYLDREILDSVARLAGVSTKAVEAIEEEGGQLASMMRALATRPKLPTVASASLREEAEQQEQSGTLTINEGPYAPTTGYLGLLTSVIHEYAAQGQAVIVGRGGQMILRERPDLLRVQCIASFETRVQNIIQREEIEWREAAQKVRTADEQRAGYMRRFYNVDWLDPGLYDLVINTDRLPLTLAADLLIQALPALEAASAAKQ